VAFIFYLRIFYLILLLLFKLNGFKIEGVYVKNTVKNLIWWFLIIYKLKTDFFFGSGLNKIYYKNNRNKKNGFTIFFEMTFTSQPYLNYKLFFIFKSRFKKEYVLKIIIINNTTKKYSYYYKSIIYRCLYRSPFKDL